METIVFKKKEYEVLEKLSDFDYKVTLKDKTYLLKTFHEDSLEFANFVRAYKRLKISGVRIPKLIKLDKKEEKVLLEYIEGENMINIINQRPLKEEELKKIFTLAWYAEAEKITLDYHPDKFLLNKKGEIVYIGYDFTNGVDDKINFKTTYVKLWFFTRDFVNYAKSKGLECDMSRLKDEYVMNKEIVLAVVKYYM